MNRAPYPQVPDRPGHPDDMPVYEPDEVDEDAAYEERVQEELDAAAKGAK